eukprot:6750180-Prymnesium_polylepis.1
MRVAVERKAVCRQHLGVGARAVVELDGATHLRRERAPAVATPHTSSVALTSPRPRLPSPPSPAA